MQIGERSRGKHQYLADVCTDTLGEGFPIQIIYSNGNSIYSKRYFFLFLYLWNCSWGGVSVWVSEWIAIVIIFRKKSVLKGKQVLFCTFLQSGNTFLDIISNFGTFFHSKLDWKHVHVFVEKNEKVLFFLLIMKSLWWAFYQFVKDRQMEIVCIGRWQMNMFVCLFNFLYFLRSRIYLIMRDDWLKKLQCCIIMVFFVKNRFERHS